MSLSIKNKVALMWQVEDDTYSYQGMYEFTKDEYAALDWDALLDRQIAEYSQWREMMSQLEAQQ